MTDGPQSDLMIRVGNLGRVLQGTGLEFQEKEDTDEDEKH